MDIIRLGKSIITFKGLQVGISKLCLRLFLPCKQTLPNSADLDKMQNLGLHRLPMYPSRDFHINNGSKSKMDELGLLSIVMIVNFIDDKQINGLVDRF